MANKLTDKQLKELLATMQMPKQQLNAVDNSGRLMPRPEENPASKEAYRMFLGQLQRKQEGQKRYINDAGPAPVYKNIGEKVRAELERESRQRNLEASIPNEKFNTWVENVGVPAAEIGMYADMAGPLVGKLAKSGVEALSKLPLEGVPIINKAYKLNPWAFQENPALFYRQIFDKGNPAVFNKLKETALGQNGKVLSAHQLGMSEEDLTKQGLDLLTRPSSQTIFVEGVPVQTAITERPSEFPFFQKGERYWKTNLSPSDELLIESKPNINDNFFPASIKHIAQDNFEAASKWSEGKHALAGVAPNYSSANFNFYKPNWIKGYEKIKVPERVNENTIKVLKSKK